MKVKELIEELKKFDGDYEVIFETEYSYKALQINSVEYDEWEDAISIS